MEAACVRGLPRGAASRPFPAAQLLRALHRRRDAPHSTVYVDVDAAGFLVARGVGARAGGGAELCVRAALAPHVQARTAALCLAPAQSARAGGVLLQLVVEAARAPHEPLRLWPDERAARLLRLPHLAPHHIVDSAQYRCDTCGARFADPNPLKVHLFLGCAPPDPARFWRRVATRLATLEQPATAAPVRLEAPEQPATPAPVLSPARLEALAAPVLSPAATPAPVLSPARLEALAAPVLSPARLEALAAPVLSPARLEALAAAWGRGRGGGGAHACLYCGKAYSRAYGLKIHIRTHTGHRPLRCPRCARAFADPSNLNKHVRLHAPRPPRTPT